MTIEIRMLQRDRNGKPTGKKVSHKAKEGHSVSAFYMRGGRSHKEFEKLDCVSAAKILRKQADSMK